MTGANPSTHRPGARRRALTLVEMAISIILVSLMLAVALKTVGASKISQRTVFDRRTGQQLAEGLMSEILEQDYADGVFGPDSFGLNAEELTTGDRSLFDDVDDYNGWTASPPQHKDGTEMAGRSGWRRTVAVHWVDPIDLSTVVGTNQGVKRVVVVVSRDTVPVAQLQAIRTSGIPDVEACCLIDDTCMVTDENTCLALGGWPQGANSNCFGSTCCTPAVVFESLSVSAPVSPNTSVDLDTPSGTSAGDLLIAVIVVDDTVSTSAPVGGWTQLAEVSYPMHVLTVAVWWKLAEAFEPGPHTFSWPLDGDHARYAWMMRFTGHSVTNTINTYATATGMSTFPVSPEVVTSLDNCMILRVGGFDGVMITPGDPGLPGHTAITMGMISGSGCSGGAGYVMQAASGASGLSAFELMAAEEYATVTIAVPAAECD